MLEKMRVGKTSYAQVLRMYINLSAIETGMQVLRKKEWSAAWQTHSQRTQSGDSNTTTLMGTASATQSSQGSDSV